MGAGLSDYQAALDSFSSRTSVATGLGLERTLAVLERLGNPHRRLPALHVAGTNGKGSTVATLEAILRARGHRVARYTSPHLVDFRERIVVDGAPVSQERVMEFIARHGAAIEHLGASFFEATTALAFEVFADAEVDAAIIEVGLGGRLDSTNVITPLVAGVTAIGLDHMEYLGTTRFQIAAEKAGIFKAGRPAVIGELDHEILDALTDHAESRGASRITRVADTTPVRDIVVDGLGTGFTLETPSGPLALRTALAGRHQAQNAATALAMLDVLPPSLRVSAVEAAPALATVRLPGRFQRAGRYIFDVAHNPDGAAVLAQTLALTMPAAPIWALLTVLNDKDWRGMMRALAPRVAGFVLTRAPTAPPTRAWNPAEALAFAQSEGMPALLVEDFDAALARVESLAATVLVTGSFHTVGDAMSRLQVDPLAR